MDFNNLTQEIRYYYAFEQSFTTQSPNFSDVCFLIIDKKKIVRRSVRTNLLLLCVFWWLFVWLWLFCAELLFCALFAVECRLDRPAFLTSRLCQPIQIASRRHQLVRPLVNNSFSFVYKKCLRCSFFKDYLNRHSIGEKIVGRWEEKGFECS